MGIGQRKGAAEHALGSLERPVHLTTLVQTPVDQGIGGGFRA